METYRSVHVGYKTIVLIRGNADTNGKRRAASYFSMPLTVANASLAMEWAKKIRVRRPKMAKAVNSRDTYLSAGWLTTRDGKMSDTELSISVATYDMNRKEYLLGVRLNAKDMMRFSMLLLTRQHEKIVEFISQRRPHVVADEPSYTKIRNKFYDIEDCAHSSSWGHNWEVCWEKVAAQFVLRFNDEKFILEYEDTFYIGDNVLGQLLWFCENHAKIKHDLWHKWWAWPIIDAYKMIGHEVFGEQLAEKTWHKYNTYCH